MKRESLFRLVAVIATGIAILGSSVLAAEDAEKPKPNDPLRVFGDISLISSYLRDPIAPRFADGPRGYGFAAGGGITGHRIILLGAQVQGQFAEEKPVRDPYTGRGSQKLMSFYDLSLYLGLHTPQLKIGRRGEAQFGISIGESLAGGERRFDGCAACFVGHGVSVRGGAYLEPMITFARDKYSHEQSTTVVLSWRRYFEDADIQSAYLLGVRRFF